MLHFHQKHKTRSTVLTRLKERDGLEAGVLGVIEPERRDLGDNVAKLPNLTQHRAVIFRRSKRIANQCNCKTK
jgi:hypothetical protein